MKKNTRAKNRTQRNTKSNKKKNNRLFFLGIGGVVLLGLAFILAIGLRTGADNVTGDAISIHYYGVTGYPMEYKAGAFQTHIKLKQPVLKTLENSENRAELAEEIIKNADFHQGILDAYQKNPPSFVFMDAVEEISKAAHRENDYFRDDEKCLKRIGETYSHWGSVGIFMVSELKYQRCQNDPTWLSAYVEHYFFNGEGNRFICNQGDERNKIFLVKETNGKVTSDLTKC